MRSWKIALGSLGVTAQMEMLGRDEDDTQIIDRSCYVLYLKTFLYLLIVLVVLNLLIFLVLFFRSIVFVGTTLHVFL